MAKSKVEIPLNWLSVPDLAEIRGRNTFELARRCGFGEIKGKNTLELAQRTGFGEIRGRNTFELARRCG
ncbi:hypothetical protein [Paenibacillus riograndensis]|uniref:hypothetical protein n=1 Tax=Paenibacillus riograndensis TaxID=483937 RepID=UPI001E504D22|nr:hypothetical protein [Paenibacillus riograndensis]